MHSLKQIANLIKKDFVKVSSYEATENIRALILKNRALIVSGGHGKPVGILTVYDILERPNDFVINCMRIKKKLSADLTISEALEVMQEEREEALAVHEGGNIIGIVYKDELLNYYHNQLAELKKEISRAESALKKISWIQSHRVRQPVASILGLIQLMDKEPTQREVAEIMTLLRKSIVELDKVISDTVNTADYF